MATAPSPTKPRTYRDFLTPLLHRQFASASCLVLGVCWIESAFLSSSSLLRSWTAWATTTFRTPLLFIPCLAVFVIRLTDLHFGARTASSDLDIIRKDFLTVRAVLIALWYIFSAIFFGEIYIWSKGQEAHLGWVDYGRAYERPRLNENPMFLRYIYFVTAAITAFAHIYWDMGCVKIKPRQAPAVMKGPVLRYLPIAVQELIATKGVVIRHTVNIMVAGVVCSLVTYWLGPRSVALQFAHFFGTTLNSQLPYKPSFPGLIDFATLMWQAVTSILLLALLWSFSGATFSAFISQPPLKRSQPLTSEIRDSTGRVVSRSSDPNASLLTGIKSKKNAPHMFALWELSLICTHFDDRRKTMFLEVDKTGGSTWSQIYQQCIEEIQSINTRISTHLTPANNTPEQPAAGQAALQGLPRIAGEQVKQGDILHKPLPDLAHNVSSLAKSAGSHPNAQNPLSPVARKAVNWSKDRFLSPELQASISSEGLHKETTSWLHQILRSPFGVPFRQRFDNTVRLVVFGTPYSAQDNIIHAASTLATLQRASLVEDTCGVVAKDVPATVRLLTATITRIQQFVRTTQPHWTDVYFDDKQRQVKEVDELVLELQKALETIVLAFSEYASAVGLSQRDLRDAKQAIGMHERQEMVKM